MQRYVSPTQAIFAIFLLIILSGILAIPAFSTEGSEPEEILIDHIKKDYTGVLFDHSTHTMLAEKCGACHHHTGTDEKVACLNCHDLEPSLFVESASTRFISCKNCHMKHDPENPGMPGLKVAYHRQCFSCHNGIEGIGETPAGCIQLCHERR